MTTTFTEEERQKIAQKLAGLSYRKARKEIRKMDNKANLKFWRNGAKTGEIHTTYELPTLGLKISLVEIGQANPIEEGKRLKKEYFYTEARVEPLAKPPAPQRRRD
ncbi:MAG: hypothetical protein DPW16_11720 [Chloroflexi bacterium]|nr:hypothetical protein [Chloroflexota bacterium]